MTQDDRILIVGAGPVGLSLACMLAAARTPFRIIDGKPGTVTDSRALGVHARTLEIMQSLDLANDFIRSGRVTRFMTFHDRNRALFSLDFHVLERDTAFPFYLIVPQSETEDLLYRKLRQLGGEVEWNTSLRSLEEEAEGVLVNLENETASYPYVVGCDGAASLVRKSLGISFSGITYDARFVLSEVRIAEDRLATDATHVLLADDSVVAAIPLPNGAYRLVGPDSMASTELESGSSISFDAFADFLKRNGLLPGTRLYDPSRVVSYRMQKRVADSFMTRRVFLAGDAAHIHSPAGGQGMNMGIQDAANLAWKLALAHRSPNGPLLNSYGIERRAIAEKVANGTDKALRIVGSKKPSVRFALRYLAPMICRVWQPYRLIRAMSQLAIAYGSEARPGPVGERLPWVRLAKGGDLFDLLTPGHFTLVNAGMVQAPETTLALRNVGLIDNRFYRPSENVGQGEIHPVQKEELARLGPFVRLLVRPDGYVAAIDRNEGDRAVATLLGRLENGGWSA